MARASALPESRLRAKRRARRRARLGICALGVLLLGAASVFFLRAPFVRIQAADVQGAQSVPAAGVQTLALRDMAGEYALVIPKNSIFFYPRSTITRDLLAAYPAIKDVELQRSTFSSITIKIDERSPLALWCGVSPDNPQACVFLDEGGVAYSPAPEYSSPIYLSYFGALSTAKLPAQFLTQSQFHSLVPLVDALAQKAGLPDAQSVYIDDSSDVHEKFPGGFEIRFPLAEDGGDVLEHLTLALQSDPFTAHAISDFEYLDLRFGDKLYYKLK